jgi:hypothetical protein
MAINLFGREGAFPQAPSDPDTDEDAEKTDISTHAFDLIIADECHRGYTAQEKSIWRKTINKTHFTVFDCFDGSLIRYFKGISNFKIEPCMVRRCQFRKLSKIFIRMWIALAM